MRVEVGERAGHSRREKSASSWFNRWNRVQRANRGNRAGLALAKKFVEMHGGKRFGGRAFGKGSRFCFTIPTRQCKE